MSPIPQSPVSDAPIGDVSRAPSRDASPIRVMASDETRRATATPGSAAPSFAKPTAASAARSQRGNLQQSQSSYFTAQEQDSLATTAFGSQNPRQALPRSRGSSNLRNSSLPIVPGSFQDSSQFVSPRGGGHLTDSEDDDADLTEIRHSIDRGDSVEPLTGNTKSVSFSDKLLNVTKTRGGDKQPRYASLSNPLGHVTRGSAYYPDPFDLSFDHRDSDYDADRDADRDANRDVDRGDGRAANRDSQHEAESDRPKVSSNLQSPQKPVTTPFTRQLPPSPEPESVVRRVVSYVPTNRKITGYVIPKPDLPQGSRPILSAYEVNAHGQAEHIGEFDKTLFEDGPVRTASQDGVKLCELLFDTVQHLNDDLAVYVGRLKETQEELTDERDTLRGLRLQVTETDKALGIVRQQLLDSDGKLVHLQEQIRLTKGDAHVSRVQLEEYRAAAEHQLARVHKRKDVYKKAYEEEYTARLKASEEVSRLQALVKKTPPAPPPNDPDDSDSEESDDPAGAPRPDRRGRASHRLNRTPLPAPTHNTRRPKQPEPDKFEGPTGTRSDTYQKWKLDIMSWFRAHASTFEGNEAEQLDFIRMKTGGLAWQSISIGWFVPGREFQQVQQVWDILDRSYGRLNTRHDAHDFYDKEASMKAGENISAFLSRFQAGVAALLWDDEEMILQVYKKLPSQWRTRIEPLLDDDRYITDFAAFSQKLRRLEQLHSSILPAHSTSKNTGGNNGGGGGGNNGGGSNGGGRGNRNRNNDSTGGSGASRFVVNKPYKDRTLMETQVLADLERCFKCTRAGHRPNSPDAPCKGQDDVTSMGRFREVLAALNEARKAAGVPIPKAAVKVNAVQGPTPPGSVVDAFAENA